MGIHGIYKEIGPGQRIALSKLAVQTFERTGRPLRLAIDTSIWLFQIQSGKGGTNPALRTFYYRLLRLLSLSIHPLFVFDGPNKPPFKRHKRTGPNIASIPEMLAKDLLRQFGFPSHRAPGEAEAECALLQREGVVDAVLSEDVDTLMFGSGLTLRSWSPEQSKSKTPTHVNLYDAEKTKQGASGLDREGMVLVAMMSGGDYIPEGVPGCGPKLACEAARAGFGKELCAIKKGDKVSFRQWRERLSYELRTNESKFFRIRHAALTIPDDFPNTEVLRYYTNPVISSKEKVENIRGSLRWDNPIDFPKLRTFTADAFDWCQRGGAKKFIRNLAPAVLVRELRRRGELRADEQVDDLDVLAAEEGRLVRSIHGKRNHPSTDGTTELRVAFRALDIVPIDLDAEEPDDEMIQEDSDADEEAPCATQAEDRDDLEAPGSPSKKRAPSQYDPDQVEKVWIFETYVKNGAPLKVQDWEEAFRNPRKYVAMKHANRQNGKTARGKQRTAKGAMPVGALDRFTRVMKPHQDSEKEPTKSQDTGSGLASRSTTRSQIQQDPAEVCGDVSPEIIDLLSSSPAPERDSPPRNMSRQSPDLADLPATVTKRRRRRSPARRSPVRSSSHSGNPFEPRRPSTPMSQTCDRLQSPDTPCSLPSPSQMLLAKRVKQTQVGPEALNPSRPSPRRLGPIEAAGANQEQVTISLLSPSPARQRNITDFFSPSRQRGQLDLAAIMLRSQSQSPTRSAKASDHARGSEDPSGSGVLGERSHNLRSRSPLRRTKSAVTSGSESAYSRAPEWTGQPEQPHHSLTALQEQPATTRRKSTSRTQKSPKRSSPRTSTHAIRKVKQTIRVRESLPGAFAIDEVDLSGVTDQRTERISRNAKVSNERKTRFRSSEVGVLDLTGM